jgi:hypothetical protein
MKDGVIDGFRPAQYDPSIMYYEAAISDITCSFKKKYGDRFKELHVDGLDRFTTEFQVPAVLYLILDYRRSDRAGRVVFDRELNDREIGDPSPDLILERLKPVVDRCASKVGLGTSYGGTLSGSMFRHAVTVEGDCRQETLPSLCKLLTTIDNLVDLYIP